MLIFFLIWSTHCLEQMCLLIVTQVTDVMWPMGLVFHFHILIFSFTHDYCTCHTCTCIYFHFICVINKMISASYRIVVDKKGSSCLIVTCTCRLDFNFWKYLYPLQTVYLDVSLRHMLITNQKVKIVDTTVAVIIGVSVHSN